MSMVRVDFGTGMPLPFMAGVLQVGGKRQGTMHMVGGDKVKTKGAQKSGLTTLHQ